MKYVWFCLYEAHSGIDYACCRAMSIKPTNTKKAAENNANNHSRKTGHSTVVEVRDGRKLKGWHK